MAAIHVIVSTHTTRHLRRVLLGIACQTIRPTTVIVTCDNNEAGIGPLVLASASELAMTIDLVRRAFQGQSRSSQVRNNGVRALLETRRTDPGDRLVFFDGDCCPLPDTLAQHHRLGDSGVTARPVVAFRIDLSPEQTELFDEASLGAGRLPIEPTPMQLHALRARHRRYLRHVLLRRLGLVKAHKPKLLSANFSVPLGLYQRVNGFDEEYIGYGQEDDDLGRRLYKAGPLPAVGVARAIVYHQHHPTRAPAAWEESPNAARFARPWQQRCGRGLQSPIEQPEPVRTTLGPGREISAHTGVSATAG
jgi:hypothetical protein